jgi:hypothetical protein
MAEAGHHRTRPLRRAVAIPLHRARTPRPHVLILRRVTLRLHVPTLRQAVAIPLHHARTRPRALIQRQATAMVAAAVAAVITAAEVGEELPTAAVVAVEAPTAVGAAGAPTVVVRTVTPSLI